MVEHQFVYDDGVRPEELGDVAVHGAYAYVLGQYLGDGCLSEHRRRVFRLRVNCSADWPLVMERLAVSLGALLPSNAIGYTLRSGCIEVGVYSKRWPSLLPQHGPGRKHLRSMALTDWQKEIVLGPAAEAFVCGLLHSDGCRVMNRVTVRDRHYEYPRYFFSNRSEDIHRMLADALARHGVTSSRSGWQQSVARSADVALLDRWGADKAVAWPTLP